MNSGSADNISLTNVVNKRRDDAILINSKFRIDDHRSLSLSSRATNKTNDLYAESFRRSQKMQEKLATADNERRLKSQVDVTRAKAFISDKIHN